MPGCVLAMFFLCMGRGDLGLSKTRTRSPDAYPVSILPYSRESGMDGRAALVSVVVAVD